MQVSSRLAQASSFMGSLKASVKVGEFIFTAIWSLLVNSAKFGIKDDVRSGCSWIFQQCEKSGKMGQRDVVTAQLRKFVQRLYCVEYDAVPWDMNVRPHSIPYRSQVVIVWRLLHWWASKKTWSAISGSGPGPNRADRTTKTCNVHPDHWVCLDCFRHLSPLAHFPFWETENLQVKSAVWPRNCFHKSMFARFHLLHSENLEHLGREWRSFYI